MLVEDAKLVDGMTSEEGAVSEADATREDGAMPEECLTVKLAEAFVRKPVDAPVPMGWVPLFIP